MSTCTSRTSVKQKTAKAAAKARLRRRVNNSQLLSQRLVGLRICKSSRRGLHVKELTWNCVSRAEGEEEFGAPAFSKVESPLTDSSSVWETTTRGLEALALESDLIHEDCICKLQSKLLFSLDCE